MAKSPKKNPSNAEIMSEVIALKGMVKPLVPQVKELMEDKHDRELIAKYVASNPPAASPAPQLPQRASPVINQELIKALGVALTVILALVTLVASYHGVVTR